MTGVNGLKALADRATGADATLDAALAEAWAVPPKAYTASVEQCHALLATVLPGWRLHVGCGATGIFPYAQLTKGTRRSVAEAPTVPLAILRAAVAAVAPPESGASE